MRKKIFSITLLIAMLFVAGCASEAVPTESAPAAEEAVEEKVAEDVVAEAPNEAVEAQTLTVLAAASLTESFTELGEVFESENAGITVAYSFAGSQALAQQLDQGAEADVFASANTKYMTAIIESGRVNEEDSQIFAHNRLVVIFPSENPGGISDLQDLANEGLKIVLADESVPVGNYTAAFLDKASADPTYGEAYKESVKNNVVSYEDNVKAVVTKVSLGEADAGIVYITDITAEAAKSVTSVDIPDELNTIATYPIAPLADSENPELAQTFVNFVLSAEGQAILGKYGFVSVLE